MDPPPKRFPESLTTAISDLLARARATPTSVELADQDFVAHLQRVAPEGDLAAYLATLNAPDLRLAAACARGLPAAVAEFDRRYLENLGALVPGMGLTPSQLDELRQVLREKLLVGTGDAPPRIATYSGRGALLSWVRIAASRAALDLVRGRAERGHVPVDDVAPEHFATGAHGESLIMKSRYREPFVRALKDAFGSLSPEQRNHLRLAHVDGLSVDELGALFKVHRATAARWVQSARAAVLDEAKRLLKARLTLDSGELDSLYRDVASQLDLSLGEVLPEVAAGE